MSCAFYSIIHSTGPKVHSKLNPFLKTFTIREKMSNTMRSITSMIRKKDLFKIDRSILPRVIKQ